MSACVFCRVGQRQPGTTSLTLTRGDTAVIIHHVPTEICDTCEHAYFDEAVVRTVEALHDEALAADAKYAVREYHSRVA